MTTLRTDGPPAPPLIRDLSRVPESRIVYSFCTLVTRLDEYRAMTSAFIGKGFGDDCEFLYVDNSTSNRFDAFGAYNLFLQEARGRYVVLCHQDILPLQDGRSTLDDRLAELDRLDANWGLCGNAGGRDDGRHVYRLMQGDGEELNVGGPFPVRVMSLDENFIVVRKQANLVLSRDLSGFHWYGADLCIVADILGWNAYVIDFHLHHKSPGKTNEDFRTIGRALAGKYARAFRPRWHHVPTMQPVYLSASPWRAIAAKARVRLLRLFRA